MFQSTGRMLVSGQLRVDAGMAVYSEELVNFYGTNLELMQSVKIRENAHTRVHSLHPDLTPEPIKLEVGQVPKASIFQLRCMGPSGPYTQEYLKALMDVYIAEKKEMRAQKGLSTAADIRVEIVEVEKQLKQEEEELHDFQKDKSIGFLREDGNSAGLYLAGLNQKMADLKTEYDLLELLDLDQNLDRQGTPVPAERGPSKAEAITAASGPMAEYLKAKQFLQQVSAERENLLKTLQPKHPTIVALDEQITKGQAILETYREQSIQALKTRRESFRIQIENLQGVIKKWEAKALELAGQVADLDKIKSKIDRTKATRDRLMTSLRSVEVSKNIEQDTVTILEPATAPISVTPDLGKQLITGFGLGLLLGLAILFILDKLDDRISSFYEFREKFPEPLLGQVPREKLRGETMALLVPDDERHALLESFRTLRSSIIFLPVEGSRPKTLLVTSATPSEGKTTIASNLAITFAFSGAKTLLVDADLRLGRLHKSFGVSSDVGFSDVMRQRLSWREAIIPCSTPNLSILPRGKTLSHPSEHFLGKVTDQFLQEVYSEFDYIVFDSPPVMAADDVLSLAPKIDGSIFIIRFSTSSARRSRTAIDLLAQRQANVLGVVCNDVKLSETEYGYGSYYQYSGYRYREEAEKETAGT